MSKNAPPWGKKSIEQTIPFTFNITYQTNKRIIMIKKFYNRMGTLRQKISAWMTVSDKGNQKN